MNANLELIECIYEDANMACFTLKELLKDLEGKDNKIKPSLENILEGYERYLEESKMKLEFHDVDLKDEGFMAKMSAKMGIKKDVKSDNSDSSIADMMIKGISMGTIDMEKKIKTYKESAEKDTIKFAKDFFKFQEDNLDAFKKFL